MLLYPEEAVEHLLKFPDVNHSVFDSSVYSGPYIFDDRDYSTFEAHFPIKEFRDWFHQYRHYSILLGIIYISAAFLGKSWMKNRPKYDLRGPLVLWNAVMATFSGFLVYKFLPHFLDKFVYMSQPTYALVCDGRRELTPAMTWLQIFGSTKAIEFLDTAFIVLRKQPLAFIHWFHHATVVIICWYALGAKLGPANAGMFSFANVVVHTVMYTYYGLKAARVSVPKIASIALTSMQIAQMFVGLGVNLLSSYYFFFRSHDRPCDEDFAQIFVSFSVYFIYILLFCQFFYKAYLSKTTSKTTKTE